MTVWLSASVPGRALLARGSMAGLTDVAPASRRAPAVVGIMRSREDIEDLYHTAAAGPADAGLDGGWTLDVADALAWVLGRSEIAPATIDASLAWPSVDEVMAEREVANAVVAGRTDVHDRPREWMVGVEYALRWAAGGT
jgi:hypothetical protein